MKSVIIEGQEVKVGEFVGFKCDIEQYGKIKKIVKTQWGINLVLTSEYGFDGGYIGGDLETIIDVRDAYMD